MNIAINVRTNKKLLSKADKVFSAMGMTRSAGVNMFLNRVASEQALPFTPTDPSVIRARWDKESTFAIKKSKRFNTAHEAHNFIFKK
jgi:addiction module RelB/DinJ family antitoxin